jgi:hypothetical protein
LHPKSSAQLRHLFPHGDKDMVLLKNVRNFLTHYGDKGGLTKEFIFSREVYALGEKARLFLEVCLLGCDGYDGRRNLSST